MDAVKFIEEHRRMHKVTGKHLPTLAEGIPAEDVVKEVEEWSAAHPRKTRQDGFLAHYPDAQLATGTRNLQICPRHVYRWVEINCNTTTCYNCQKDYWLAEVE